MAIILGTLVALAPPVSAEEVTILLDDDREVTLRVRVAGRGQQALALELSDGRLEVVPEKRVLKRVAGDDPVPISHDELKQQLTEEFGATRVVTEVEKPYVIVLIRARPGLSDQASERRFTATVKKAGVFFKGMQQSFLDFVKQARVETKPIRFPLGVLIFESDAQFNAYTVSITGQDGLSAQNIAAFYDLMSNRLVLRLRECTTFDTPLHEAVHQQVYNRGVLQRLAPIPLWFNEGLATAFEGDGERVRSGPRSISDRYGTIALRARVVNWSEIVRDDRTFQGDVLAAEAYGHAWGLHWWLVNKYRSEYNALVRLYAAKEPLSLDRADQRLTEFEQTIGKTVSELQREFQQELPRAMARRKR